MLLPFTKMEIHKPRLHISNFSNVINDDSFSWWVSRFGTYNQLYGSIGTVLIIMILIFINSLVLLIGFELNVSISSLKKLPMNGKINLPTVLTNRNNCTKFEDIRKNRNMKKYYFLHYLLPLLLPSHYFL